MSALDLEAYARLLARMACQRERPVAEILAELGLDAEAVKQAEAAHRDELANAWTRRSGILAMKFAAALGKELLTLGPLVGSGRSAGPKEPDLAPPPLAASGPAREPERPSFLQPAAPAPSPPAPAPALAAPAPPAGAAPAPAPPLSPMAHLAGTGDVDLHAVVSALARGALPFARGAGAIAEKPPGEAAPRPRPTGTVQADFNAVKASVEQGALPFGRQPGQDEADFALLPLETYASLTRALARGEPREEALARHRVAADVFDRVAKAWAARFQREPHLFARFKELATGNAQAGRKGE